MTTNSWDIDVNMGEDHCTVVPLLSDHACYQCFMVTLKGDNYGINDNTVPETKVLEEGELLIIEGTGCL